MFVTRVLLLYSVCSTRTKAEPKGTRLNVESYFDALDELDAEERIVGGSNVPSIKFRCIGGNREVSLTGWGSVHHFGSFPLSRFPTVLQRLPYTDITNEECKERMRGASDTEGCALEGFGKAACNGDSGGPLVMPDGGQIKQVGIVSYGMALCASSNPDVYTRVSMFQDCITQHSA
uniref:Peptidase S1 domain-containing protein n=1 Tax=Glossina morsitans morsitans TaxID=37546 RepID=A0A1B0FPU6_GLOMM